MAATRGAGGYQRRVRPSRTKAQMCLWLPPELLSSVRRAARERGVPASELIERYVRAGMQRASLRQIEEQALPLLTEAVRVALDDHARQTEERLAKLLTRTIIASDTTRRLLFAHMARQWGGSEQIRQAHESARTASINALRERGWVAALRLDVEDLAE